MECFAYLHLALEYESPTALAAVQGLNWNKLSSQAWVRFLPWVIFLSVLNLANAAFAQPMQFLKPGDNNAEVTNIQQRLQVLGYFNTNATGYYGPITREAVMKFQQDHGITVTGVVGPLTHAYLFAPPFSQPLPPSTPMGFLQLGDTGNSVATLQRQLQALGFYRGPINRYFDLSTQAAVIDYQRSKGLALTGQLDANTYASLFAMPLPISPALPPPLPMTKNYFQMGENHPQIGVIQRLLQGLRLYNGPINNYFNAATQQGVMRFQEAAGLSVSGMVGPTTLEAMYKSSSLGSLVNQFSNLLTLEFGQQGEAVRKLQTLLARWNYNPGPIDGVFGVQTKAAVFSLQRDLGLYPDGCVTAAMQSLLSSPRLVTNNRFTPGSNYWY